MSRFISNTHTEPNISKKIDRRSPIKFFEINSYTQEELDRVNMYIHKIVSDKMDGKVNRVLCYRHSDIKFIVDLYDRLVLDNIFSSSNSEIICRVSHHQATFNGKTDFDNKGRLRIVIYVKTLSNTFIEDRKYSFNTRCFDRLECMLSVIRHELIHAFIRAFGSEEERTRGKDHGSLFVTLYKNIFNSTVTTSYSIYDIDIYPERGQIVGKQLKKGKKAKIIKQNKIETVTILEEPITYENSELILYKTKKGTIGKRELLLFKSPKKNNRVDTKKNTLLSPISSQQQIRTNPDIKSSQGFELGLSKKRFETVARKRGISENLIKVYYKHYNREQKELQGGI